MSDRPGMGSSEPFDQGGGPDPLVTRLQSMSPVAGVEVDFDAIAAEAGRRRSRRTAARAGLGVGGIAAALVVLSTSGVLRLGLGGSSASSAAGGAPASVASAPLAAGTTTAESAADPTGGLAAAESRASGGVTPWNTAYPVELCPESVPTVLGLPPASTGSWNPPFQPTKQLVPAEPPVSAVVCRYRFVIVGMDGQTTPRGSTQPLFTARRIGAGLDTLAQDLSALPATTRSARTCPMTPNPPDLLLLRLDYSGGGVVWVQTLAMAGNSCPGATNGPFATDTSLGDSIEAASQMSQWLMLPSDRFGASPVSPGR